jgi:hypothetical protein
VLILFKFKLFAEKRVLFIGDNEGFPQFSWFICKFNVVRFISTLNLFLSRNTFLKPVSNVEINSEKINVFMMSMFYGEQTY